MDKPERNTKNMVKNIVKSIVNIKSVIIVVLIILIFIFISMAGYFITVKNGMEDEDDDSKRGSTRYTSNVSPSVMSDGNAGLKVDKNALIKDALIDRKFSEDKISGMTDEEIIDVLKINKKLKKKPKVTSLDELTEAEILWCMDDVYSDYLKKPEELEKLLNAEIITQYPKMGEGETDANGKEKLDGIIQFERHQQDGSSKMLKFIKAETFNSYVSNGDDKALDYFTLDEEQNAVIAYKNTTTETLESNDSKMVLSDYAPDLSESDKDSDGNYKKTTVSIGTEKINYKNATQKYVMPFKYLWSLLVIGRDRDFVLELADLVENSEITISIYDNVTTTTDTDVFTYKKQNRTDTYVEVTPSTTYGVKNVPTKGYWWPDDKATSSVGIKKAPDVETEDTDYKITHTIVNKINRVEFALTKADVWIVDYSQEYTYQEAQVTSNESNTKDMDPKETEYVLQEEGFGNSKDNALLLNCDHAKEMIKITTDYIEKHKPTSSRAQTMGTDSNSRVPSASGNTKKPSSDGGSKKPVLSDKNINDNVTLTPNNGGSSTSGGTSSTTETEQPLQVTATYVKVDRYQRKIERKESTTNTVSEQKYVSKTPVSNPKDDKDADKDNFVKILRMKDHFNAKDLLINSGTSWLWKIMNNTCSDMIDLTKYLFYKVTGKNYGVKEYDFSEFNAGSFSNTTGGIYGNSVQEKVWFMLKDLGYSDIAAAGAMGNIHYESGSFDPTLVEGSFNENNGGIGICQWTNSPRTNTSGRNTNLKLYAASKGKTWQDEDIQVEYLRGELTKGGGADGYASYQLGDRVKFYGLAVAKVSIWENATTIDEATQAFCYTFERPNKKAAHDSMSQRIAYAQQYYNSYSGKEKPLDITTNLTGDSKTKMEALLAEAQRIANDDRYTYSQANRFGELQYDCSSFVYRLYSQYFGISVPMSTSAYGTQYRVGAATSTSLQPGDVLWRSGHVTIYIGNGVYVAAHTDKVATEKQISVYNDSPSKYTYVYRFITN